MKYNINTLPNVLNDSVDPQVDLICHFSSSVIFSNKWRGRVPHTAQVEKNGSVTQYTVYFRVKLTDITVFICLLNRTTG